MLALLLANIDINSHFALTRSPESLSLLAGCFAALAAPEYYFGFRLLPHRPTSLLVINAVFTSIAVYFLVYYIDFSLTEENGTPISRLVSFSQFMSLTIENRHEYVNFINFGRVGFLGYLLVAIQIAEFAFGGLVVAVMLLGVPCCDRCDRILKNRNIMVRAPTA